MKKVLTKEDKSDIITKLSKTAVKNTEQVMFWSEYSLRLTLISTGLNEKTSKNLKKGVDK